MDEKNIWEQNLEKLKQEVLQNPYWKIKIKKSKESVKTVLQNQIKTLLLEIVDVSERFEVFFSSADYKIIEIGRLKSNYINLLHFFDAIENGNIEIVDGFAFYIQYKYFIDNENVKIIIFDILGRKLETLLDENLTAGVHEVNWNASRYAAGVYFYMLLTDGTKETKKMILIK